MYIHTTFPEALKNWIELTPMSSMYLVGGVAVVRCGFTNRSISQARHRLSRATLLHVVNERNWACSDRARLVV